MSAFQVMLLPGIVLPAELAYGGLVTALGQDVETIVKDLNVYREDAPPPDYSLDTEVAGILREADARGWSRFHLVGYSGGGAAALAFAARQPARLLSLALLEPAWAGNWDSKPGAQAALGNYEEIEQLPHEQLMRAFAAPGCALRFNCPLRHRVPRLRGWDDEPPESVPSRARSSPTAWTATHWPASNVPCISQWAA